MPAAEIVTQQNELLRDDRPALLTLGLLLLAAFALGGGGVRYAMMNLGVQLVALGVLAFRREAVFAFWRTAPLALRILVGASILLPLLHLMPLPQRVWSALPGRELVVQSFELIGRDGWAPASVDPVRTIVALTGLIAPFAILTGGWTARRSTLLTLGWIVAALGLLVTLLGIVQVLAGSAGWTLFGPDRATGLLYGTFANRNTAGLFLVAILTLVTTLPAPRPHVAIPYARAAVAVLLFVAIVLTKSRSAMVLAAIPALLFATRTVVTRSNWSGNARVILAAGVLALCTLTALAVAAPGRIGEAIERFEAKDDPRRYLWEDAAFSAARYWPAGAGMGTFDEVFQIDESLENTAQRRAGRAHNDYLEIAIEAGLPGLLLIAAWFALCLWLAWRARRSPLRWTGWAGAGLLLAIALQSATDYPLRNQAMLCLAAFALLVLARIAEQDGSAAQ